jgi:hypothetical protein
MSTKASIAQARRERNRRGLELFYTYHIELTRQGETWIREFKATNPGSAFARCLDEFPSRIFLESWRTARLLTEGGEEYRLVCAPAFTISCHKRQNGDATSPISQPNPSHIAADTAGEKSVPQHYARRRHWVTGTSPAVLPHANGE